MEELKLISVTDIDSYVLEDIDASFTVPINEWECVDSHSGTDNLIFLNNKESIIISKSNKGRRRKMR